LVLINTASTATKTAIANRFPEATGQTVGQAEAAFRLAQQHQAAVQGDRATAERLRRLFATEGWKIEGKKGIVGHGGCGRSIVRVEDRLDNDLYHLR
jgi:hypothetical protein